MPIVDVEIVHAAGTRPPRVSATVLAAVLGRALGSEPGQTLVRIHFLPTSDYAENDTEPDGWNLPVFVTIRDAHPPEERMPMQLLSLTQTLSATLGLPVGQVYVEYAPGLAGRAAFGGQMFR